MTIRQRSANIAGTLIATTLNVVNNIAVSNITTSEGINAAFLTIDNLKLDNNEIISTEANGNLVIAANGTGVIKVHSDVYVGVNVAEHFVENGYTTESIALAALKDANGPAEIIVVNENSGTLAYSEFLALNDTANQEQGWISIGINSSNYDDPEYTLTGPDDGYLLFEAPLGTSANGDLIIGTGSYGQNNHIVFAAGGFEPEDAQLKILPPILKTAEIVKSSLSSNIATLTTANTHTFVANDIVLIASVGAPYDGQRKILGVTSNTFTVPITSTNLSEANVSPAGSATQVLPFNRGSVELTAQLFVGEGAREEFDSLNINLDNGVAVPLGTLVDNDGPGQTVMINKSNGTLAYTEYISHNDVGDVDFGWISFGINSSNYDDPEYPITKADDGYLLYEPPANTTGDGDLIIGTGTSGQKNRLIFAAKGFDEPNAQMIITPDESVRISINADATSANTGALQVVGGVGVQGSVFVQGNQTIQGDLIVNGSQVIQSIASVAAAGPISLVGDGNIANTWDFGIVGTYAKSRSANSEGIVNKVLANNLATLTTANNHEYLVEDYAVVTDVDSTFNGTHRITAVTSNTFSYFKLANNITSTAATGNVSVTARATYTGAVKDTANSTWKLVSNIEARPDFNVNFANTVLDNLQLADGLFTGTVNANNFVTSAGLNVTDQANNAYAAANNRVLKIGDTMTGELKLQGSGISLNVANISYFASNVGIGTTSPAAKLHIFAESTGEIDIARFLTANGADTQFLDIGADATNNFVSFDVTGTSSGNYLFRSGGTERVRFQSDGNVGIGTTNASSKLDVIGDITANGMLGRSYSQTSYSSNTAIFDTIATSGAGLYQVVLATNPNSGNSASYIDWIYGKVLVGTGWNGSAATDYIYFVQENPDPRTLYDSGGGNLAGDAVFNVGGSEFSSLSAGTSYTIRFKVSGYTANPNSTIRLTKIG
jgi:hypothetical protein